MQQPVTASLSALPRAVGSFHLVFPFNEATHRAALAPALDVKLVIRQSLQQLKEALGNTVSSSKSAADRASRGHTPGLWAPITGDS